MRSRRVPIAARLLAALAFTAVAGCGGSTLPATAQPDVEQPYPNITVEGGLSGVILAGTAIVSGGKDGRPLKITVPVRSTAGEVIKINYRFEYLDSNGRPTETNGPWRTMALPDRIEHYLEDSALGMTAVDWRLQIRPAVPQGG